MRLKELGAKVLGMGDEDYSQLHEELKAALAEYYKLDLENLSHVKQACRELVARHGPIHYVESHQEWWLILEAHIREELNITSGWMPSETMYMQKKSVMKQLFIAAGLNVPRGQLVGAFEDTLQFIHEVGFPVVIKPDRGVGADSTFKICNEDDLRQFYDYYENKFKNSSSNDGIQQHTHDPCSEYFVEEFIDGDLVTFDGLTDGNGDIVFCDSLAFVGGIMDIVNMDCHQRYWVKPCVEADVKEAGIKAVQAFKLRKKMFHIEFFRTKKDNKLVALEANLRPPGGVTVDMVNFAFSFDFYKQWANVLLNNKFDPPTEKSQYCCFTSRKYKVTYAHSHDEVMQKYSKQMKLAQELPACWWKVMGDYCYLFTTPTKQEMDEISAYIQEHRAL